MTLSAAERQGMDSVVPSTPGTPADALFNGLAALQAQMADSPDGQAGLYAEQVALIRAADPHVVLELILHRPAVVDHLASDGLDDSPAYVDAEAASDVHAAFSAEVIPPADPAGGTESE